jgi:hypothetical protein
MASESRWKGGRLGPFHLGRRYKDKDVGGDLGRIYEAHNVETGAAALVLMPGKRAGWEPEESWQVRAFAQVTPPYVALEVEQAPATGKLPELADMLDLLTSAVERLEKQVGARVHLTRAPVGLLKRWVGRLRRLHRSRGAVALMLLMALCVAGLGVTFWVDSSGPSYSEGTKRLGGVAETALESASAPFVIDRSPGASIAYPLPQRPFSNQAKPPCRSRSGEVEINGGCWLELAKRSPCYEEQAEHQGKCYAPVSTRPSVPLPAKP